MRLCTITFHLRTMNNLHSCTAAERVPELFVQTVLMLDCSEASINGMRMLNIS